MVPAGGTYRMCRNRGILVEGVLLPSLGTLSPDAFELHPLFSSLLERWKGHWFCLKFIQIGSWMPVGPLVSPALPASALGVLRVREGRFRHTCAGGGGGDSSQGRTQGMGRPQNNPGTHTWWRWEKQRENRHESYSPSKAPVPGSTQPLLPCALWASVPAWPCTQPTSP